MFSLSPVVFYVLAAITLGSAGSVAFSKNIIHATLSLLGTFMGIAGLYITLSADFLAATQVIVYVGGTLTLILFAVMLTARIDTMEESNPIGVTVPAFTLIGVLLFILGRIAMHTKWSTEVRPVMPSTAKLGHAFLGEYLLPFELGSVVLLAAMIGAVVLARRAVKRAWEREAP
jgi:NADH-quinone oxidoreductase subunit J